MKGILRRTAILTVISLVAFSCGQSEQQGKGGKTSGSAVYGGKLDIPQVEKYQSLFPQGIEDIISFHVATQIYDGLFEFDPRDMSTRKNLVKEYEVSGGGTLYTFHLKKGVKFHPDPCFKKEEDRLLVAEDVITTFTELCRDNEQNSRFSTTFDGVVKGARAFYEGKVDSVAGLRAIDEHTVRIELVRPNTIFLDILASPMCLIFPKDGWEQYGTDLKVGTGPFMYDRKGDTEESTILVRNPDHYEKDSLGNSLPYLDTLQFHYINSKSDQLRKFKAGELDMTLGLPSSQVKDVVKEQISHFASHPPRYILERTPELSTDFLEFNMSKDLFQDAHVRKAIGYAVDRERIVEETLNGEAYGPAQNGITPPSLEGYPVEKIDGFEFKPGKAREHLEKAGYPDGEGFPAIKIQLNSGGDKNTKVAFEIQKQLRNVLNINVDIEVIPFAKMIEDSKFARGDIYRKGWIADYPSPKNFLLLAYGANVPESLDEASWPNTSRYQNETFDRYYEKGARALEQDTAYKYFILAEKNLMEDPPFVPLYHRETYWLLQSEVHQFYTNPLKYLDCSRVFLKKREKTSTAKKAGKAGQKES